MYYLNMYFTKFVILIQYEKANQIKNIFTLKVYDHNEVNTILGFRFCR